MDKKTYYNDNTGDFISLGREVVIWQTLLHK